MPEPNLHACVCLPGSFDMQFDLQVGVGTLIVAKPLDAEVQSVYNMTVQVTDGTNLATAQVSMPFTYHARLHHTSPPPIKLNYSSVLLGEYMLGAAPLYGCSPFFL